MISEETSEKIPILVREIGLLKTVTFVLVLMLIYQLAVALNGTLSTEETLIVCNMLIMCLMYFAYMYDHIFLSIYKVFS